MFKKNTGIMAKSNETEASRNLIAAGTVIKGDIQSEGNIRIDGTVSGTLQCKGKLVVGATGKIDGDIFCTNANVSGTLNANITVTELLTLQATSKLVGEIAAAKLAIEPGAMFSGTCKMGAVIKDISHGEQQPEFALEEKTA